VSNFGAVPAAILSTVNGAITLGDYQEGAISPDRIGESQYPFAMTYNPVQRHTRRPHKHSEETCITPMVIIWDASTVAQVNTAINSVKSALDGSTLEGIVEDTWITEIVRYESPDSDRIAVDFEIETKGSV
jgi:hypothetical protein